VLAASHDHRSGPDDEDRPLLSESTTTPPRAPRPHSTKVLQGLLLVVIGLAALGAGLIAANSLGLIAGAIGILVVVVGGLQLLPGPGGPRSEGQDNARDRHLLQVRAGVSARERGEEPSRGKTWRYEVRVGDTLWDIAAKQLGDPMRWVEIAELNYGRVQLDGRVFDDVRRLVAGWVLQMPEPAAGWVPDGLSDGQEGEAGAVVRPFLPHLFDAGEDERSTIEPGRVAGLAPADAEVSEVGEAMEQWAADLTGLGEIWPVVTPADDSPAGPVAVDEPGESPEVGAFEISTVAEEPASEAGPSPTVIESWALWASHKPWSAEEEEQEARAEMAGAPSSSSPEAGGTSVLPPPLPAEPEPPGEPGVLRRRSGIRRLGFRRSELSSPTAPTAPAASPGATDGAEGDRLVQWAAAESERRRRAIDDLGRQSVPAGFGAQAPASGTETREPEPLGLVSSRRARLFRRRRVVEGGAVEATPVVSPPPAVPVEAEEPLRGSAKAWPAPDDAGTPPPPPSPPASPPAVASPTALPAPLPALGPIEIFRHRTRLPDVDETLRQSASWTEPEPAGETRFEPGGEPEPVTAVEPEAVLASEPVAPSEPIAEPEPRSTLEPEALATVAEPTGDDAAEPSPHQVPPLAPGLLTGGFGRLTPMLPGEAIGEPVAEPAVVAMPGGSEPEAVELQPVDSDVVDRLIGACHSWRSEWLSLAMRAAGRIAPEAFDAVIGAFVGEDETLLVLAKPTPAPAPIFEDAGELAWRLSTEITLDDLGEQAADLPSPCTTLVPLGWELDDDGVPGPLVLLALGAVRSLALGVPWARSLAEAIVSLGDVRFSAPWSDGRLRFVAEGDPMPTDGPGGEQQHLVVLGEVGGLESADGRLGERRGTVVVVGEEHGAVLEVGAEGRVPMLRCRVGLDRTRTAGFGADVVGVEARGGARASLEVEVNVLGPLEVRASGVDWELLERNPQLRALLAALAIRPSEPFERLVKALWRARIPGRTERGKVIQLLQRALGADRRDSVVERVGRAYHLAFSLHSDLLECLDENGHLSARVLDRVRGPLLEGAELVDVALGEGTVEALRAEVRRLAIDAAVEARRVGDLPKAYRALERGVLASPRNEQIWVELLCCASLLSDSQLARATAAMLREWGVASIDELPGSLPGLVRTLAP